MRKNIILHTRLTLTHRGYGKRGLIPENTLEAFAASTQKGFSGHELDVRLSRDGVVVVFHGPELSTTTNGQGYPENFTFKDLQQLNCGNYLNNSGAGIYKMPSLDQYLAQFGNQIITNIEIKKEWYKTGWDLERKIIDLVKKYNCQKNIVISSFNLASIYFIRKHFPEITAGILLDKKRIHRIWVPIGIKLVHPDSVHIHKTRATPELIKYIHDRQCAVALWSVNEKEEWKYFRALGVEILITDNMELL